MTQKQQCEYLLEDGNRCQRNARESSILCRQHELALQAKYGFLKFSKTDFYKIKRSPPGMWILFLLLTIIIAGGTARLMCSTAPSSLLPGSAELTPVTGMFALVSLGIRIFLGYALSMTSYTAYMAEVAKSPDLKRSRRRLLWKLSSFLVLPLFILLCLNDLILGYVVGWDNVSTEDAVGAVAALGIILSGGMIIAVLRQPRLYVRRWISVPYYAGLLWTGIGLTIQGWISTSSQPGTSTDMTGPLLVAGGIVFMLRDLRLGRGMLHEIVESFYRLPDLIKSFVEVDQRDLALAIGLRMFHGLTPLQQAELRKHIEAHTEPTFQKRLVRMIKAAVVVFLTVLLIEAPAERLFDWMLERLTGA